jgi:hypothetical protein
MVRNLRGMEAHWKRSSASPGVQIAALEVKPGPRSTILATRNLASRTEPVESADAQSEVPGCLLGVEPGILERVPQTFGHLGGDPIGKVLDEVLKGLLIEPECRATIQPAPPYSASLALARRRSRPPSPDPPSSAWRMAPTRESWVGFGMLPSIASRICEAA